jgi:electron transfer flavoprotein beta subunit
MRGIMSARTKPLEIIESSDIERLVDFKSYSIPAPRGSVTMLGTDETEKLVELLHSKSKVI